MERTINKKIETYITSFKDGIRDKISELDLKSEKVNNLIQYIYDYERLCFTKEDFVKRKRVRNIIPIFDRCSAKRSNGEQCTRKRKNSEEYCGTHMKGKPHGIMNEAETSNKTQIGKVEVWAQEIQGIIYYIDKNGNVYETEDIVSNIVNPKIIAKYNTNGTKYVIPDLNVSDL